MSSRHALIWRLLRPLDTRSPLPASTPRRDTVRKPEGEAMMGEEKDNSYAIPA